MVVDDGCGFYGFVILNCGRLLLFGCLVACFVLVFDALIGCFCGLVIVVCVWCTAGLWVVCMCLWFGVVAGRSFWFWLCGGCFVVVWLLALCSAIF